jgi:hypothetical protein
MKKNQSRTIRLYVYRISYNFKIFVDYTTQNRKINKYIFCQIKQDLFDFFQHQTTYNI